MRRGLLETNPANGALTVTKGVHPLAIHQNPAAAYLASLSTGSRRTMSESLLSIARMLRPELPNNPAAVLSVEWHQLENTHIEAIRTRLAESLAPNTANKKLAALRGVLKKAWKLGLMTREAYERAVDVEPIKGERLKRGRDVEAGEIKALFANCREDKQVVLGARDAAMLALLYGGGLRRSEVANLTLADWDAKKAQVIIRQGKGNKDRLVPLPEGARRAVLAWLALRTSTQADDPLLCPLAKGGKVLNRQMTTQAIWKALVKRALKAGIPHLSPHDCRRSFIGDLLDAGADLSTAQKLAGHSDPKITAGYDRRPDEAKRRAVSLLHVPFTG
jgi:site-specific recombinase XerD